MSLILEVPRRRQPQGPISAADWLPTGSVVFVAPRQLVGTDPLAAVGTPVSVSQTVTPGGLALVGSASSSRVPIGNLAVAQPDIGITLVSQFVVGTTSTRYVAGTVGLGSTEIEDFGINLNSAEANSAGRTMLNFRRKSGSTISKAGSTDVVFETGVLHTAVWQWRGGGDFRLWVDGAERAVTVSASGYVSPQESVFQYPLTLLNRNLRNAFSNGGAGLSVGLYARIWGVACDGAEISADPWGALIASHRIIVPIPSAGATTYTLSAATFVPGSITASSVTARVTVTEA